MIYFLSLLYKPPYFFASRLVPQSFPCTLLKGNSSRLPAGSPRDRASVTYCSFDTTKCTQLLTSVFLLRSTVLVSFD